MKLCPTSQFPFVCLGACGEIVTGSTPSKANSKFWDGGIPFVTPAQLGFQPPITTADKYVTTDGAERGRLLPEGAVLVCCIGSLGKTGVAGVPLISNQQINSIIFDPNQVDARYGYYAARNLTPLLEHFAPSTTIKIVKKSTFAKLQIPLPPLAEQKRIAGILDAADVLRAKRRESLAQLDTLLQSTFLDMFGDPVTNPMGWPHKPLSEVLHPERPISYGILKPGDYTEDGVIMLRIQDIRGGRVTDTNLHRVPDDLSTQYKRTLLSGNEIVISLVGTIGLCALIPPRFAGANVHRNLAVVAAGETVDPQFLHQYMVSDHFQFRIRKITKGGNQGLLNLGDLKRCPIPVPPISEQSRFTAIVKAVEHQRARLQAHLADLDTLFASLQQRAFNGEL